MQSEGLKYDDGKTRLELIPPEAIAALGTVFTYGAKKYADRNWEKGLTHSRLFGAILRHLWAHWSGETVDRESNLPHLAHALTSLAMFYALWVRRPDLDDRPGKESA